MRVITQNGDVDFPYERYTLCLHYKDRNCALAYADGEEEGIPIGEYFCEEDAKFAMLWVVSCYINESRSTAMPTAEQAAEMRTAYKEKRKEGEPLYKFLRRVSLWSK